MAAAQEAKKLREQAQAAEDAQLLGAAAAASAEGDLALTESHYTEAADLFRQAAELVPAGHATEATGYLSRQADALQRQGDEHGDNPALQQAIATWRAVLGRDDRPEPAPMGGDAEQPRHRAQDPGRAGERDDAPRDGGGGVSRGAGGGTRERVPLDWAMTQMNLGNALRTLGERESGTARLEEAVAAIARRWRRGRASGCRSTGR